MKGINSNTMHKSSSRNAVKRPSNENNEQQPNKRPSQPNALQVPFTWCENCFFCGGGEKSKKGIKFSFFSQAKSETVKAKILKAAKMRG